MKIKEITKQELIDLYRNKPFKEVCKILEISDGTLYKILKKSGIPTNRQLNEKQWIRVVD